MVSLLSQHQKEQKVKEEYLRKQRLLHRQLLHLKAKGEALEAIHTKPRPMLKNKDIVMDFFDNCR